jgi:hypothetical protein
MVDMPVIEAHCASITGMMPESARKGAELTPFARRSLLQQRPGDSCGPYC